MTAADAGYTGAENLEVMREAVNYNAWLLRLIQDQAKPGARVLDFGAGAGTFAAPLRQAGLGMTCLEPDAALGTMLRAQGLSVVSGPEQVADDTFDLIYSLNVLEHIEDDVGALSAIFPKLKPGGRLLIYVPAFQVLFGSMDRKVGHLRRYRRGELARKIHTAGFQVESARYADSLGFFAALALRLLDNGTGNLNPALVRLYDRVAFPLSRLLDRVCWPLFGKNVTIVARRKG